VVAEEADSARLDFAAVLVADLAVAVVRSDFGNDDVIAIQPAGLPLFRLTVCWMPHVESHPFYNRAIRR
jgi:hypothetical protein